VNKELRDQSLHCGSCLGFSLLAVVPVFGPLLVVWLWAITREYYQHKKKDKTFRENISKLRFFNLDMKWSWVGLLAGAIINTTLWKVLLIDNV